MIEGDSTEYELLEKCCKLIKVEDPLTLEIGVRQGKGSHIILENFKDKKHWHIGVDPYGNLDYQHYDDSGSYRCDYTNSMKLQLLKDLDYPNFTLFNLGDDEFMHRFHDGVPIYNETKQIKNVYDLVHLDGPHKTIDVIKEIIFFAERSRKDSLIILDDYPKYNWNLCGHIFLLYNFKVLHMGKNKAVFKKYDT
tara:strand:+ start:34 stop:615 length:582 start_codon:yes stop_codon:yes gene_type:complete